MLNKKYYTLADSKVTKRLTKLSSLNLNLPSYKIRHVRKHRIEKIELDNQINQEIDNEINKINQLIHELNDKMHDDIHFILVMKKYQDANIFKTLVKHEYPIIEMDLDDILSYSKYTKNNILIANHLDFNKDKILMNVNFLYLNN